MGRLQLENHKFFFNLKKLRGIFNRHFCLITINLERLSSQDWNAVKNGMKSESMKPSHVPSLVLHSNINSWYYLDYLKKAHLQSATISSIALTALHYSGPQD